MSDCKRGHWIKGRAWSEGHGMGEEYGFYYTCTECGKEIKGNYDKCYSVFCPECGSRNRRMPKTEEKPQNVTFGNVVPAMNKAEDDAVSREAVIEALKKLEQDDIEAYGVKIPEGFNADEAIEAVKALPPVQPERPKGEWIITYPFGWDNPIYECPECRASNNSVFKNFCPNCGTDLRGKKE